MDFGIDICAIIVSRRTDEQIHNIIHLLQEREFNYYHCRDIYAATAKLAKTADIGRMIVIGAIEELSQDDFSFPRFVLKNYDMPCYCLSSRFHNGNIKNALEAAKEKLVVLTDTNGILKIVDCDAGRGRNFPNLKCDITQDELKALLEVG